MPSSRSSRRARRRSRRRAPRGLQFASPDRVAAVIAAMVALYAVRREDAQLGLLVAFRDGRLAAHWFSPVPGTDAELDVPAYAATLAFDVMTDGLPLVPADRCREDGTFLTTTAHSCAPWQVILCPELCDELAADSSAPEHGVQVVVRSGTGFEPAPHLGAETQERIGLLVLLAEFGLPPIFDVPGVPF